MKDLDEIRLGMGDSSNGEFTCSYVRDCWSGFWAVFQIKLNGFPQIAQGFFFCRAEAGDVVIEALRNEVAVLKVEDVVKCFHDGYFE